MKVRPGVELASLNDVGCHRENNEDSYGYWEADDDASFAASGRLALVAETPLEVWITAMEAVVAIAIAVAPTIVRLFELRVTAPCRPIW